MSKAFHRGDVVQILEAYQDHGDEDVIWIVDEAEEKGRVTLVASNSPLSLKPRYVVSIDWIRHSYEP
jgi:hypothetical protein